MDWVSNYFPTDNEFFVGGVSASILFFVFNATRQLPSKLWGHWKRRFLFSVRTDTAIKNYDLETFSEWMEKNGYTNIVNEFYFNGGVLVPGRIVKLVWFEGSPVLIRRQESPETTNDGTKIRLMFSFTGLWRDKDKVLKLFDTIRQTPKKQHDGKLNVVAVAAYNYRADCWVNSRNRDTVWLPDGQYAAIVDDMQKFYSSEEKYFRLGLPYHRGYLFQGPPGTGKTTTIQAIANDLGKTLKVILSLEHMTMLQLIETANYAVNQNAIVLIEDIDSVGQSDFSQEADEGNKLPAESTQNIMTVANLLNVLDGIFTPPGLVLVMTTNFPDKINQRLLRPGRIDYVADFGFLDASTVGKMVERFCPGNLELKAAWTQRVTSEQVTPAQLQSELLKSETAKPQFHIA